MNYFEERAAAKRYAVGRPYFHPLVIGKIRSFLGLRGPIPRALDVACGTGQSTVALKEVAIEVVGMDSSKEMLARAARDDRVRYTKAPAEDLPFVKESFDLVTAALAFHWFDRARFLAEARRVLRPSGWLVIYDNRFSGRMRENPEYERWYKEAYLHRYPSPSRNSEPLSRGEARKHGFEFVERERYTNEVSFSVEELASYLTTQTNVIATVEKGTEDEETVRRWLTSVQAPLFRGSQGTFLFEGSIDYLKRGAVT